MEKLLGTRFIRRWAARVREGASHFPAVRDVDIEVCVL